MLTITSSGITDVGRKRKSNEDSLLVDDELKLYVVADGMGGHQAGEVASRIVVDSIHSKIKQFVSEDNATASTISDTIPSPATEHLKAAVYQANADVYRTAEQNELYKGMGSTVAAVYFTGNSFVAINVGDSPIYLIRYGNIESISTPHTMIAEHAALAPKGAKPLGPQYRHILTRAMGIDKTVDPATCEHPVFGKDILVMSSDGLSDKVVPEEIVEMTKQTPPNVACRSLVQLANERGGDDNITVIVLNIDASTDQNTAHAGAKDDMESTEGGVEKKRLSVEFDTEDGSYRSIINKISVDGIFIETGESFFVGQRITLTFSMGDDPASVMVTGKVVERLSRGINVIFENLTQNQQQWIESIQHQI